MVTRLDRGRGFALALLAALVLVPVGTAAAQDTPETVRDLAYGEVLFDFYNQDYFNALVRAQLEMKRQTEPPDGFGGRLPSQYNETALLRGGMSLAYGMPATARSAFDTLLAGESSAALHNRVWYFLGRLAFQQGRFAEAEYALAQSELESGTLLDVQHRLLLAQLQITTERYTEALATLDGVQGGGYAPFVDFNRGVALLRSGNEADGVVALEGAATLRDTSPESVVLRDRANLALGYYLLQNDQAARARDYLNNVRLEGPFSNRALLGAGWAAAKMNENRAALVPWRELRGRTSPDSAVLEAQLAMPYAHSKLQLYGRAAEGYRSAAARYREEQELLEYALRAVDSGMMIENLLAQTEALQPGVHRRVTAAPVKETRYFVTLLSSHRFRRSLQNYRDLRALGDNLTHWQQNMTAFDDMVANRRARYEMVLPVIEQRLRTMNLRGMRARRDHMSRLLLEMVDSNDIIGVAPTPQQRQYYRLKNIRRRLDDLPYSEDVEFAEAQHARLQGVLVWQFNYDYADNQWRLRKALKRIEKELEQAQRLEERVREARLAVPRTFKGFDVRIAQLRERVARLGEKTDVLIARQDAELRQLASARLREFGDRLDRYLLHARYGEARNYDLAYEKHGDETP